MLIRNKKETLSQNYRRLGLTAKLQRATGGTERAGSEEQCAEPDSQINARGNSEILNNSQKPKNARLIPSEVRIERDPKTGAIIRVLSPPPLIQGETKTTGAWRGVIARLGNESSEEEKDGLEWRSMNTYEKDANSTRVDASLVTAELERQAQCEMPSRGRKQSAREREWVERLVEKHGDDHAKMARDMRLNPMQQSEGDIKRRVKRWKMKTCNS